jgi:hypothetical protein
MRVAVFGTLPVMKFVLEVELGGDAEREVGRILRYWAGALKEMKLEEGAGSAIYDSAYREVGAWKVTAGDAPA